MKRLLYITLLFSQRLFAQDSTQLTIKVFTAFEKPADHVGICIDNNGKRKSYVTNEQGQVLIKVPNGKINISTCNSKMEISGKYYIRKYAEKQIQAKGESINVTLNYTFDTLPTIQFKEIEYFNLKGDFWCLDSLNCINASGESFGIQKSWYCALIESGDLYLVYSFNKLILSLYERNGYYELEFPKSEKMYKINDLIDLNEAVQFCRDNVVNGQLKPVNEIRYKNKQVH